MQFLDLEGLRALWAKIQAGDAKATTTVSGENASATEAYISVAGAAVSGEGSDGHTNYAITLHNAASKSDVQAAKEALYGGTVPASGAETITSLDSRIDTLESGSVVTVEKLASAESGYAASYIVKQNNTQVGETINIPKDFLVRSAELKVATASDNIPDVATGEKYIDFVINTPDDVAADIDHVYLPINDLVDTYTGENGVAVDNSTNKISAVVDPTSEDFFTVGANGLKVSGVQTAIDTAKSEVIGNSATDTASSSTIEGAKKYADAAVAAAAGNYASAAQGTKADTALQSVSASGTGFVSASVSEKDANKNQAISVSLTTATVENSGTADGLAVASDVKSYVDDAVADKNVDAEGDSYVSASAANNKVTVAATASTIASLGKADSAIQGVKVNSAALTPDANKVVNITVAEGATNGTIAVNGTDVAVHGLNSMAYENKNDYATAAQGSAADSALQSISNGTDGDYIDITVTPKGTGTTQEVSGTVTVQSIASADASHKGLVEASDAKAYVDAKFTNLGEITKTASGTAKHGGVFVVNQVVEENGALKSVGSLEVEKVGAAAAAEASVRGGNSTDTLASLREDIDEITGGDGSIATQIAQAFTDRNSELAANGTRNEVEAEPDTSVFTKLAITDGKLDATKSTSVLIGGIPVETVNSICSLA